MNLLIWIYWWQPITPLQKIVSNFDTFVDIGLNLKSTNAGPDLSFSFQIFPFDSKYLIIKVQIIESFSCETWFGRLFSKWKNNSWLSITKKCFILGFLLSEAPGNLIGNLTSLNESPFCIFPHFLRPSIKETSAILTTFAASLLRYDIILLKYS